MYSTRKLSITLALGLLLAGVGCQRKNFNPQPAMNNQSIAEDDVMAKRSWPQSTAVYQNASVPAGPDRFRYEPTNPNNGWWLDVPLFMANSVVLPFTYISQGPGDIVANPSGASIGSGYTAIPAPQGGTAGNGVMDYSGRSQRPQQTPANAQGTIGAPNPGKAAGPGAAGSGATGGSK
jgi:hypothetical protein